MLYNILYINTVDITTRFFSEYILAYTLLKLNLKE